MQTLNVDGLTFTFPADWLVSKYDEWSFYRNQFAKQMDSIKAVDVLAHSPTQEAFLIEVKDYRHPDTIKPSALPEAFAHKILFTLAALLPAKLGANNPQEQQLAASILACSALNVVVHIEQAQNHRPAIDLADIKQKLRKYLRAVDAHPQVTSMLNMRSVQWTVV